MMGPVWFNTTAFVAFEEHLTILKSHLLDIFFGGIAFWHSTLYREDKGHHDTCLLLRGYLKTCKYSLDQ